MNDITTWAKEDFDLIILFVGLVGVVIAVISLFYELKKKKAQKKNSNDKD